MGTIRIDGIELREAPESGWSGRAQLVGQDEAYDLCRLALGLPAGGYRPSDEARRGEAAPEPDFYPVLLGPPGVGKTTLAIQIAREAAGSRGVYVLDCHPDILAEDLIVSPVLDGERRVRYQMSPLATAAYRGAPVVLDEASRLQPAAWASIMGALDDRRSLMSVVAGVTIPVRCGFCAILRGGLDARRTARDAPAAGRIFVREPPHRRRLDADRFGAVLVAFEDGAGRARGTRRTFAKDCHHTGPKFWKRGCESDRLAVPGSGWLYGRYRALAIVLDTSRPVHEVLGLWHRELAPYPFTLARLARLVCRHAPPDRPLVAFVARRPPGRELRALAAAHGRELVHAETGAMGDLLGTIRGFHRRFDTGPDAE